jgi:hypothetical protein
LLDVLEIVFQCHLLAHQPFDGKQLDDLILGPDSELVLLCPYLQQDRPPSQLRAKVVLPLTVVDKSDLSPTRLTAWETRRILAS